MTHVFLLGVVGQARVSDDEMFKNGTDKKRSDSVKFFLKATEYERIGDLSQGTTYPKYR